MANQIEAIAIGKAVVDPVPLSRNGNYSSRFAPNARIGVPGFPITNGYILPLETDGRISSQRERYKVYGENLVNVSIIGTGVRYYLDLVADAGWTFKPADDSREAQEAAEFFDEVFDDMETAFRRVVRRAAMYKFYGFSIQEWTAKKREDGRIGLADIEPRPQRTIERWDVDDSGWVKGVIQRNPNTGQEIYLPRPKLLYVVDDSLSDSPEGLGLFRHLTRTAAGVKRFEDLEHWGFETDLQGIPVGRAPLSELDQQVKDGTLTNGDRASAVAVLNSFIQNHIRGPKTGMLLDSRTYETTDEKQAPSAQRLWDLELLKSGGTSHAEINEAIKRKTFELARLIGVEHILIGSDGGGSLALHSSSTKRLHGMVNSCLDELGESIDRQLTRTIARFNNIPDKLRPKVKHEKIEYRSVEEVVSALEGMARAGVMMTPDDPAVGEVRDLVGLSRPDPATVERITQGLAQLSSDSGGMDEEEGLFAALRGSGAKPRANGGGNPMAALDELRSYIEGNKVPA